MEVSDDLGDPQIIHFKSYFNRIFHCKPSFMEPPPYLDILIYDIGTMISRFFTADWGLGMSRGSCEEWMQREPQRWQPLYVLFNYWTPGMTAYYGITSSFQVTSRIIKIHIFHIWIPSTFGRFSHLFCANCGAVPRTWRRRRCSGSCAMPCASTVGCSSWNRRRFPSGVLSHSGDTADGDIAKWKITIWKWLNQSKSMISMAHIFYSKLSV